MYTQFILQITIVKSQRKVLSATELDWVLRDTHTRTHTVAYAGLLKLEGFSSLDAVNEMKSNQWQAGGQPFSQHSAVQHSVMVLFVPAFPQDDSSAGSICS
jgi:maltodextrin utilization protein YvdJ